MAEDNDDVVPFRRYDCGIEFFQYGISYRDMAALNSTFRIIKPRQIQAVSLPVLTNQPYGDLMLQSDSGSGRTTLLLMAMLHRIDRENMATQALCLCFRREAAHQNHRTLERIASWCSVSTSLVLTIEVQYVAPHKWPCLTAQAVVGTIFLVSDLIKFGKLDLSKLKILVVDDVDVITNQAIRGAVLSLLKDATKKYSVDFQVVFTTKKCDDDTSAFIERLEQRMNRSCNRLHIQDEFALEATRQFKIMCPDTNAKFYVTQHIILEGDNIERSVVFAGSTAAVRKLTEQFRSINVGVSAFRKNGNERDRLSAVADFDENRSLVMVTDYPFIQGFDLKIVNIVINYDLPTSGEEYVQRIRRSAYFYRHVAVINLCTDEEISSMIKLEQALKNVVVEVPWNNNAALEGIGKNL